MKQTMMDAWIQSQNVNKTMDAKREQVQVFLKRMHHAIYWVAASRPRASQNNGVFVKRPFL
jgi:hypothetical protein